MIGRFLDAGHRVSWVAGDEVYGGNPKLRSALEKRGVDYVLAVACSAEVITSAGKFRADALAASHQLLIRRNRTTGELAYYRCWSLAPVPLTTVVRVAGSRWRVEETFQDGKGPGRTGRASGPPLPLLGPLGHPRDARPRLPRRRPRR